jgi:hypothetical protein
MAALLWATSTKTKVTVPLQHELRQIHAHMRNCTVPWEMKIAHVIPRDPQITSIGDACLTGGGAYCTELSYWFDIIWSAKTKESLENKVLHINLLEFTVVILQLAAVITCIEEPQLHPQIQQVFPQGIPDLAKLLIRTDNSPSQNWAHKVSSKSERGQLLVSIYADMLDRTTFAVHSNHISGVTNTIADYISRPPTHLPSRHLRSEQIFQMAPQLATYRFFRPSPEFLSILDSRLCTEHWQESPPLPKSLGRFETAGSITSSFVTL